MRSRTRQGCPLPPPKVIAPKQQVAGSSPARGTRNHIAPAQSLRNGPRTSGCVTPASNRTPPWKSSTSPPARNSPPRRSATSPPCVSFKPANPSSCTDPSASGNPHRASPRTPRRPPRRRRPLHQTSRALADLAGGHADRTWPRRLAELVRPALLILDDFAMRELTAQQADDLYELISEGAQAGRSLVATSNRSPTDWYPLFPNPVVAESVLDRLITPATRFS
jgi:IstB-like ATP binding protein